jgi:hypothetical protein
MKTELKRSPRMPQDLLYEKKFWNVQVSLESTLNCCDSSELPSNVYGV